MVARERLPVEQADVHCSGSGWTPRGAAVGARERLPMEQVDVHVRGAGRVSRGAAVATRERLPVEQDILCVDGERYGHLEVLQ